MIEITSSHEQLVLYIQDLKRQIDLLKIELEQAKLEGRQENFYLRSNIQNWISNHNVEHTRSNYYNSQNI